MAGLKFGDVICHKSWPVARLMYLGFDSLHNYHQAVILIPEPIWHKASYPPGKVLGIVPGPGIKKVTKWPG